MDDPTTISQLIGLGRHYAQLNENMSGVTESFLDGQPVEPFRSHSEGREPA
jgi:hypothetical protein